MGVKRVNIKQIAKEVSLLDCSQSPIFLWDFRDSYASTELPPSLFVRASATWGECLNYRGVGSGEAAGKIFFTLLNVT